VAAAKLAECACCGPDRSPQGCAERARHLRRNLLTRAALPTRRLHEKHGCVICVRPKAFYAAGDDKIIYHKRAHTAQTE